MTQYNHLNFEALDEATKADYLCIREFIFSDSLAALEDYMSQWSMGKKKAVINIKVPSESEVNPEYTLEIMRCVQSTAMCQYLVSLGLELQSGEINYKALFNDNTSEKYYETLLYFLEQGMYSSIDKSELLNNLSVAVTSFFKNGKTSDSVFGLEKMLLSCAEHISIEECKENRFPFIFHLSNLPQQGRSEEVYQRENKLLITVMGILLDKGVNINKAWPAVYYNSNFQPNKGTADVSGLMNTAFLNNKNMFHFLVNYKTHIEQTEMFIQQLQSSKRMLEDTYYQDYLLSQLEKLQLEQQVGPHVPANQNERNTSLSLNSKLKI